MSAILIGGIGIGILMSEWRSADPGSWIQFAGAMLGSGVTVAAAMLVAEHQIGAPERRELRGIAGDLSYVLSLLAQVGDEAIFFSMSAAQRDDLVEAADSAFYRLRSRAKHAMAYEPEHRQGLELIQRSEVGADRLRRLMDAVSRTGPTQTIREIVYPSDKLAELKRALWQTQRPLSYARNLLLR